MAIIGLPPRIEPPAIIEGIGTPEFYRDGWVIRVNGSIVEAISYRTYAVGSGFEHREVCRIMTPVEGFDRSLFAAYAERCGGVRH